METVVRITIVYIFIVFGLRVLGKRQFSELSPLELVTLLLIPELVAQALVREDFSMTNALIGVSTLFALSFLSATLTYKSKKAQDVIFGTPSVLVQHGHFVQENLDKERVPTGDVFAAMHEVGLERLEQVKWAVLEQDGRISIVPADEKDRDKRGQPKENPAK